MDDMTDGGTPPTENRPVTEDTQFTVPVPARIEHATAQLPQVSPGVRYNSGAAAVPTPVTKRPGWLSPTLSLRQPADDEPVTVPVARPRRRRRWLVAVVAIILVAGGAAAYLQVRSQQPSPAAAVRTYFDDLAAGDTAAAMALVDSAGSYSPAVDPLLSPAALARTADRPGHLSVSGSAATTAVSGRKATAVSVTYTVGATMVEQTITVLARDPAAGGTRPYLLKAPFITVSVPAAGDRTISVNGVPIPSGTTHTLGYPAAYVATATGNQLIAASSAPAVYTSAPDTVRADITLPPPIVAPGASEAVQAAVDRALDTCATSTAPAPPGCPFRYLDSSATLKWKMLTYPQVRLAVKSGAVTFDDNGRSGSVRYDASTSYFFGLIPRTDSGTENTDVAGTATVAGGTVTVMFQ
jgi:hypothetical protein